MPSTPPASPDTGRRRPLAVALTGGIGSGKSAVADLFAEQGVTIIDADAISHQLTATDGPALPRIADAFGPQVLRSDGSLNRAVLRKRIFDDPAERRRLEGILHPMIRTRMQAERNADSGPYLLLAIPLLVETGQTDLAERILVVDAPEALRIARVGQRSGLAADAVRRIIANQASRTERLAVADDVIDNSGTLDALRAQVETLHLSYLRLAEIRAQV